MTSPVPKERGVIDSTTPVPKQRGPMGSSTSPVPRVRGPMSPTSPTSSDGGEIPNDGWDELYIAGPATAAAATTPTAPTDQKDTWGDTPPPVITNAMDFREVAAAARVLLVKSKLQGEELTTAEAHAVQSTVYLPWVFASEASLTALKLVKASVTDTDVLSLVDGLLGNTTLTSLDISDNFWITDRSTALVAELLLTNRTLRQFAAVQCPRITDASMHFFAEPLAECNPSLVELKLGNESRSNVCFADAVVERWLRINAAGPAFSNLIRGRDVDGRQLPVSVNLTARATAVPLEPWAVALACERLPPSVRELSFAGQNLGVACAPILSHFLESSQSSHVATLDLRQCGFTDHAVSKIALALDVNTSLRSLLFGTKGNDVAEDVARYIELMLYLNAQPCGFKSKALRLMAKDDSLVFVHLDPTGTGKGFTDRMTEIVSGAVRAAPHLRSVATVHCGGLTAQSVRLWANVVTHSHTIQLLDLSGNEVGVHATALAHALRFNDSLFTLKLAGCGVPNASAVEMAEALRRNRTLTELDLSHNVLVEAEAATSFLTTLKANATLKAIAVDGTGVPAELARQLVVALRTSSEPPVVRNALPLLAANSSMLLALEASGKKGAWWLRESSALLLAAALKGNTRLTSIDVSGNQISSEGMVALAGAVLAHGVPIQTLSCAENPMGNGVEAFEDILVNLIATSKTLTAVDVSNIGMTRKGAQRIVELLTQQRAALTSLDASQNALISTDLQAELQFHVQLNVCSDALRSIAHKLLFTRGPPPSLKTLDTSNIACGLSEAQVTASVRCVVHLACQCPSITAVLLHGNSIGRKQVEVIAGAIDSGRAANVAHWDLSGNDLDDACLERLMRAVSTSYDVKAVDVGQSHRELSPALVKTLKARVEFNKLPMAVKEAMVVGVDSGSPCLDFSARMTNHLTDSHIELLCTALIQHKAFSAIDLSNQHVTNAGLDRLVEMAAQMPSLHTLRMQNTLIRGVGVGRALEKLLASDASCVAAIDLSDNDLPQATVDGVLAGLQSNTSLTSITVGGCTAISQASLDEITRLTEANRCLLRPFVMQIASGDPIYTAFHRHPVQCSPPALRLLVRALAASTVVVSVDLTGHGFSDEFGSEIVATLATVKTLRSFDISDNHVGDGTLDIALRHLEHSAWPLTYFAIAKTDISDEKMRWLSATKPVIAGNATLTELVLDDRGDADVRHFAASFNLNLQAVAKQAFVRLHRDDVALTTLDLQPQPVKNDITCYHLMQAAMWNNHLQVLSLADGAITDVGVAYLCECLFINRSVSVLDLSRNLLTDGGARSIADMLKVNSIVRDLRLEGNDGISSSGMSAIETVLRNVNDTVHALAIDKDSISQEVADDVDFSMLLNHSHPNLKVLYLASAAASEAEAPTAVDCHAPGAMGRGFEDTACRFMCKLLETNATVTAVDISQTQITMDSSFAIENMLKVNRTITSLDLSHNIVGEGVKFVVRSLLVNDVLRRINVDEIPGIDRDLQLKLTILLRSNREPPRFKEEVLMLIGDDTVPPTFVVQGPPRKRSSSIAAIAAKGSTASSAPALEAPGEAGPAADSTPPSMPVRADGTHDEPAIDPLLHSRKTRLDDDSMNLACAVMLRGTSLKRIDFSHNAIGDDGFAQLIAALVELRFIRELYLGHNDLTDRSVTLLCDTLPSLPVLMHVNLVSSRLTESSAVRAQDAARQFPQLHSFEIVGEGCTAISADSVAPLRFYLQANSSVTEEARDQLVRAYTNDATLSAVALTGYRADPPWLLDATYVALIAFALRHNTHVQSLTLSDCNITDANFSGLLSAIHSNSSIVHIDLSLNGLVDINTLCDMLLQRQVGLRSLLLRGNSMAVASARALASMLRTTEDLEVLDVSDNAWGRVGATIVQSALQSNRGLRKVELAGKNVPASVVAAAKYSMDGYGKAGPVDS